MHDFTGRTALITGSGVPGGLGHAVARTLAGRGAHVVLTGRDAGRGAEALRDVLDHGGDGRFVEADLGDEAAVRRLAAAAGPVDVLIHNAAVVPVVETATSEHDMTGFDDAFTVNVRAAFLLTALVLPGMAATGAGSVVLVSSTAARLGMPGIAVYGATKAALESLARTWAVEFATAGIRVNAVAPGPILSTKMISAVGPDGGGFGATTPMSRVSDPDEVAEVVAFVASDRASYMTGAVVAVDGGRTAI